MSQWPVRLILLAATTGILLPYCFPRYDLGLLAWVALIPLHIALDGLSRSWAIEIADLVGFLLGPSGRSITGQRIVVCAAASL